MPLNALQIHSRTLVAKIVENVDSDRSVDLGPQPHDLQILLCM